MFHYILFDLDGTLTASKEGITKCVQHALHCLGIEEPDLGKLESFIGPPLKDQFMEKYNLSEEQALLAIEKYRERFKTKGMYENELYPGAVQMLQQLHENGFHLYIASSKPKYFVDKITDHFEITRYFEYIMGSDLHGGLQTKGQVIGDVLGHIKKANPDKDQIVMIGDRLHDIEGARENSISSIGVSYGYGGIQELKEAKAETIIDSIEALTAYLLET